MGALSAREVGYNLAELNRVNFIAAHPDAVGYTALNHFMQDAADAGRGDLTAIVAERYNLDDPLQTTTDAGV